MLKAESQAFSGTEVQARSPWVQRCKGMPPGSGQRLALAAVLWLLAILFSILFCAYAG